MSREDYIKKAEEVLKKLEEEYFDIYNSQVEFKKGYRDYDNYKVDLVEALYQLHLEGVREKLEELQKEYQEVQEYLDKEYGEGEYCPNYEGILENRLEDLREKLKK